MDPTSFLLPRPPFDLTDDKRKAFDDLFASTPEGSSIDYHLPYPKWEFLSYLCESQELVLHGSQNLEISTVEPRQAIDIKEFSNQKAIYATTDGIWVIYFSIPDRQKYRDLSLFNSCLQAQISEDQFSDPLYFFSITHSVLVKQPWCDGAVYILPRQTFEQEAPQQAQGFTVVFPHWISTQAVEPLAKLKVSQEDFPFIEQIHGHDDEILEKLAVKDPAGFPWPEALVS
ncbi:hypothetical protein ACFLXB_09530 [Chloroflexota bacterium]